MWSHALCDITQKKNGDFTKKYTIVYSKMKQVLA